MKQEIFLVLIGVVSTFLASGCASPRERMHARIDAGRYEEALVLARDLKTPCAPLQHAVATRNLAAVTYYLDAGADPNFASRVVNIVGPVSVDGKGCYRYKVGYVPASPILRHAMQAGDEAIVRLLLSHKADPDLEYAVTAMQPFGRTMGGTADAFVAENLAKGESVSVCINGQQLTFTVSGGYVETSMRPTAATMTSVRKEFGNTPNKAAWLSR